MISPFDVAEYYKSLPPNAQEAWAKVAIEHHLRMLGNPQMHLFRGDKDKFFSYWGRVVVVLFYQNVVAFYQKCAMHFGKFKAYLKENTSFRDDD